MRRASRRTICQPAAVSGDEVAARAAQRNPVRRHAIPTATGSLSGQEVGVALVQGQQQGQRGRRVRGSLEPRRILLDRWSEAIPINPVGKVMGFARAQPILHPTLPAAPCRSCTTPLSRSSLYPVIGNGFAPACRAVLRQRQSFAALAGLPCNAASTPTSRSGTGAMPPAVRRMNWNVPSVITARAQTLDQRPFRMAAADRALVERALALQRWRKLDALDHLARLRARCRRRRWSRRRGGRRSSARSCRSVMIVAS